MSVLHLGRLDAWEGVRAVVLGFGPSGFAAADNLTHLGASVLSLDGAEPDPATRDRAELLEVLGATVRLGEPPVLPDDLDLLVISAGHVLDPAVAAAATDRGVPVWSEVELAWRVRHPEHDTGWLVVAGGRAGAVVPVLHEILRAAGLRVEVVGEPTAGARMPVVEAVMDPTPYDVLVVAAPVAQLRHTESASPLAAAVLLGAEDVDGGTDLADLAGAYHLAQVACVYDLADPRAEDLVREADVVEGARAVAVTLGMPGVGMLGLVEDLLVDRAFIPERASSAAELGTLGDVLGATAVEEPDPAVVTAALVAAALARAQGVDQAAVRAGLRAATRG